MTKKERARLVARQAHANQTYDIYPYYYHTERVAAIAEELGFDEAIVCACYLHDTLEDTPLSYNDLKFAFGEEIAEIVYAVTDELGRNRKERKAKTLPKIRANWKATVVKICDRVANMEQSMDYNKRLYEMYQKEHESFCNALLNPDHPLAEVDKAWARLASLMPVDMEVR